MAANYDKPVTTDNYVNILTQLRDNIGAAQTLLNDLTGVTNIPTGAIRYDQTLDKFQSYDGATFNDLILSPSGGGTGITNWDKASIAEAESGAANKYPDAAGVLASINANGFSGGELQVIWTGTASTVDLDALPGGYPGDGLYVIACRGPVSALYYGLVYSKDGEYSRVCVVDNQGDIFKGTPNVVGFSSSSGFFTSLASIEKVI